MKVAAAVFSSSRSLKILKMKKFLCFKIAEMTWGVNCGSRIMILGIKTHFMLSLSHFFEGK